MNDHSESSMIALLPITSDWCHMSLPHLTLVYAGEIDSLKPTDFNDLAKDAASIAMLSGPITLQVTARDVFGEGTDQVDVYKLRPSSELMAMRNVVARWNASEWDFTPHVTIGDRGSAVEYMPKYIAFDRIMVTFGKESLTFWLKRGTGYGSDTYPS